MSLCVPQQPWTTVNLYWVGGRVGKLNPALVPPPHSYSISLEVGTGQYYQEGGWDLYSEEGEVEPNAFMHKIMHKCLNAAQWYRKSSSLPA